MNMRSERGSVLLVALILAAVLVTVTARLYKTAFDELNTAHRAHLENAAYYLAEAGLEEAARRIRAGEWSPDPNAGLEHQDFATVLRLPDTDLGRGNVGAQRILLSRPANSQVYLVKSIGHAKHREDLVELRAIQATVELLEGPLTGPGYVIAVREDLTLQNAGGEGVRVSSYDSDLNFGRPDWQHNFGYDAALGSASARDGAINLGHGFIRGTVRTGGGTPQYRPPAGIAMNGTRLQGPHTPADVLFDPNRVTHDFAGNFCPTVPPQVDHTWVEQEGWLRQPKATATGAVGGQTLSTTTTVGSPGGTADPHQAGQTGNPHQPGQTGNPHRQTTTTVVVLPTPAVPATGAGGGNPIYDLGGPASKTRVHFKDDMVLPPGQVMQVEGDVVVVVDKGVELRGELRLLGDATLTIYVQNLAVLALQCGDWAPSQFVLHTMGSDAVQMEGFSVFSGLIHAPDSVVTVRGSPGLPRTEVRGSIAAKAVRTVNEVDFYYDVRSGDALCDARSVIGGQAGRTGAAKDFHVQLRDWKQIVAAEVAALLPPGAEF